MMRQPGEAQLVMRAGSARGGHESQRMVEQAEQFRNPRLQGKPAALHQPVKARAPCGLEREKVEAGMGGADDGVGLRFGLSDQRVHERFVHGVADLGKGAQAGDQRDAFGINERPVEIEEDRVDALRHALPPCAAQVL